MVTIFNSPMRLTPAILGRTNVKEKETACYQRATTHTHTHIRSHIQNTIATVCLILNFKTITCTSTTIHMLILCTHRKIQLRSQVQFCRMRLAGCPDPVGGRQENTEFSATSIMYLVVREVLLHKL